MIDNVVISLLEKMGFKNITVTHGSLEKGKDLLFYKENEFEEKEYTGVQVKTVDIHGRAGEKGNATEILNQAQQAFTHGFQDTYDNKTKNIDRYIVMTSGNTTMEFDDSQIKRFSDNWFGEANKNKAQSMLKAVMENENIKTLARNPLMVAIIAIIYEEDRELPQRRADLYKRVVDVLLSRWDLHKKLKNRFKSDQKEFILRKPAFQCHYRNRREMTEKEILEDIYQYSSQVGLDKKDAKPFLEEIWQRSYLLKQIAMDTYDFLHLSFQEYLTALELKEQEDGIGTIIEHIAQPWWEEPILLYAGICKDAGSLIQRIQKEVPEDIFCSNLILLGKCITDAEFTEPKLKEEIVKNLWYLYQNGEFSLLNRKAMRVLRRINPHSVINFLINRLNDEESEVRMNAASALGAMSSIEAVPELLKTLNSDKNSSVRGGAASALGKIGDKKAILPLKRAL